MDKNAKPIVVIGAGLCGSLLAARLAKRGQKVLLFERRTDIRLTGEEGGRSINLALSIRGLNSLNLVGADQEALKMAIPMQARMIHFKDGSTRWSPYSGREGDYINSISRGGLNALLLDKAEQNKNLEIRFNTPCLSVDIEANTATFRDNRNGKTFVQEASVIIGTDGAGSAVRRSYLARSSSSLFNYSQHFLEHGYKELHIYPNDDGSHKIKKNCLHIWPRGNYMVIALPNLDGSFTVTCFFPYKGANGFEELTEPSQLFSFFKEEFPDAFQLMPNLISDFYNNPTGSLGTIKCYPWTTNGNSLLMGDAAHAIVPFYGQGMNCSFEDVLVFDQMIDEYGLDWATVFSAYQNERKKDTDAIADLAIDNFYEMRDHVANEHFIRKRNLEMKLEKQFDDYYSKYSLVTFRPDLSYHEAMVKGRAQDEYLMKICKQTKEIENIDLIELNRDIKQKIWR
jgi:kynurenine 3-monooxygenase